MKNISIHKSILSLTLVLIGLLAQAQELNCQVVINSQQVINTERDIYDEMEDAFEEFLNNNTWTEDAFKKEEKIDCGILITLDAKSEVGNYFSSAQIISNRPTYNTTYSTALVNFGDRDFNFPYLQSQQMIFNQGGFNEGVVSLLAYYAYIILGYDYDSFESLGGTTHFQMAREIVSQMQQSGGGWDQFGSNRNRYWLSQSAQDQILQPTREAYYDYHINGMDIFLENPEKARTNILECLKKIQLVNKAKPRSVFVIAFMDAKSAELVNVFSKASLTQKREAYNILKEIDPSRTNEYKKILE